VRWRVACCLAHSGDHLDDWSGDRVVSRAHSPTDTDTDTDSDADAYARPRRSFPHPLPP